jgi:quercetin dioxygenase-like cupin family protein
MSIKKTLAPAAAVWAVAASTLTGVCAGQGGRATSTTAPLALPAPSTPVIENVQVHAAVVTAPLHITSLHESSLNRVMVYLDAGTERLSCGGRVDYRTFHAGEIRWIPREVGYTSENTGSAPCRVLEIELKGHRNPVQFGASDPVRLGLKEYEVLLDNSQVRVLHARIAAKGQLPFHEHGLNRIVVYLTDQHMLLTEDGGKVREVTAKAAEVRWSGPTKHGEVNLNNSPFELSWWS